MAIEKLEDFRLWKESMKLRRMVYKMVKSFPKEEKFISVHHLKECARNVPGNVAEAFGRYHYLESIHFYLVARGSVNEIKSDTYAALEEKWVPESETKAVIKQCDEVIKMINGIIASSHSRKNNQ